MSKTRIQPSIFALALALTATIASMLIYPGGTTLDHATRGYSLHQNFLSDLGMTVAYDGRANAWGAALFFAAVVLFMAGMGVTFVEVIRDCWQSPRSRYFVVAAGVVGLITALTFVGVGMSPENSMFKLHLSLTLLGFALAPVVTLLLTLALLTSETASAPVTGAFAVLTCALAAYVIVQHWGPNLSTQAGLVTQVLCQKAIVLIGGLAFLYAGARNAATGQAHT